MKIEQYSAQLIWPSTNRLLLVDRDLKKAFGKILRELRLEKKISQQELADCCNIERAYVSRLERGLFQPTIGVVFKIAECIEVKPSELVERVDLQSRKGK